MNIYELFALDDESLVDHVFDAWRNSSDSAHWDIDAITDRCAEDIMSDLARDHFRWWFEDYCCTLDDPCEVFADKYGASIFERRIAPLADAFAVAVFLDIEEGND